MSGEVRPPAGQPVATGGGARCWGSTALEPGHNRTRDRDRHNTSFSNDDDADDDGRSGGDDDDDAPRLVSASLATNCSSLMPMRFTLSFELSGIANASTQLLAAEYQPAMPTNLSSLWTTTVST